MLSLLKFGWRIYLDFFIYVSADQISDEDKKVEAIAVKIQRMKIPLYYHSSQKFVRRIAKVVSSKR